MIIINLIDSLTKLYVIVMSLDYLHDYNFYIEDLPMTYLKIAESFTYDIFIIADSCDKYYDFHYMFTDLSLSILISYNKEDFIGEDIVYNTIFL